MFPKETAKKGVPFRVSRPVFPGTFRNQLMHVPCIGEVKGESVGPWKEKKVMTLDNIIVEMEWCLYYHDSSLQTRHTNLE